MALCTVFTVGAVGIAPSFSQKAYAKMSKGEKYVFNPKLGVDTDFHQDGTSWSYKDGFKEYYLNGRKINDKIF